MLCTLSFGLLSPSQPLILIFGNIHVCVRRSSDRLVCGSILLGLGCRRLTITVVTPSVTVCRLRTAESVVGHPLHLQLADVWDLGRGIDELDWLVFVGGHAGDLLLQLDTARRS